MRSLGFGFCHVFIVFWDHWRCLVAFASFSVFGLSLSLVCLHGILVEFSGLGRIPVSCSSVRHCHCQCWGLRTLPGPRGVHVDQSHVTLKETLCAPSVVRSMLTFLQVLPLALSFVNQCPSWLLFPRVCYQRCDLLEFIRHHHVSFEALLPCLAVVILCLHMWPRFYQAPFVFEQRCDLQPQLDVITSWNSGPFPLCTSAGVAKYVRIVSAACAARTYVYRSFDHAKGNTNHLWKSWGADITCLQETRIGKNNARTSTKNIEAVGLKPILGQLLPGLWHANGATKTPCGGTAILGADCLITPFEVTHDQTGLFQQLFNSKRVAAAWFQVTPKVKALVFSVYACTGASSDSRVHIENNKLFNDLLVVIAQFGEIPVIVAGDFQAPPGSYESFAGAINFQGWVDPLSATDEWGHSVRPYTYSKDCSFSGADEGCTSIDGVLLNKVAFCAMVDVQVMEHRPIKVTFHWESIRQTGFILHKFAPLDVSGVPSEEWSDEPSPVWQEHFAQRFESAPCHENKWEIVNEFFQKTLLDQGGVWGSGPRVRAKPPVFVEKKVCPKQLSTKCAATRVSLDLYKLINRLDELSVRLSRAVGSAQDGFNTTRLALKTYSGVQRFCKAIVWAIPSQPTLVELHLVRRWAETFAMTIDSRIRLKRVQSWKRKINQSAEHGCAYIFQHLRQKAQDEPPNLVTNSHNQIVTQPEEAIQTLNEVWGDIFAANVLSELDGWRTQELQAMHPSYFHVLALFFKSLEESDDPLPRALVFAKQVILNKPGPASATNKKQITVLPPLLLAYTGARYAQLQQWQQQAFPSAIIGGVKHRAMSNLSNEVRLELDSANLDGDTVVGIKLDKSKAFDRIIPQFAACLFVAFGIPTHVASIFIRMYQGMHKHLAFRSWTSPVPVTHANGVAQGCSFSILAMNAYNKVWYHLIENLPGIAVRAYIDDAYLWCRIIDLHHLKTAVQLTGVWDALVGQKLNTGKSSLWSNNAHGRKHLKAMFADFAIVTEFEVLGTRMYTSAKSPFGFSEKSLKQALCDIDNIAVLPVSQKTKSFLIGATVIPRLTFGAHISRIPKRALDQIQNAIARCLWYGRPKWRSKWLVQAVLSAPHRTEPTFACAYQVVLETIRSCHLQPAMFLQLQRTMGNAEALPHSLANRLLSACETLGLEIDNNLCLSFQGSNPTCITELSPQDARRALQAVCRHSCYARAINTPRKDFCKPQGIFDQQLSTLFLARAPATIPGELPMKVRFESVVVGCSLTNDRMAATGWSSSSDCRFCQTTKESMNHLTSDCHVLHRDIGAPVDHQLGRNFRMLGHVEHPKFIGRRRFLHQSADDLVPAECFNPDGLIRRWTDGSVVNGENFWLSVGTFSIIDEGGQAVSCGMVSHWALSSYVTELWAIFQVFFCASTPAIVFSDCQSAVSQVASFLANGIIDVRWQCQAWWRKFRTLVELRRGIHPRPFSVTWIPAHVLESVPDCMVTEENAREHATTKQHILLNRVADRVAKHLAHRLSPVDSAVHLQAKQEIYKHQHWLSVLHAMLPTKAEAADDTTVEGVPELPEKLTECQAAALYPQWHWSTPITQFRWKAKIPVDIASPKSWRHGQEAWKVVVKFLSNLQ